MTKKFPGLSRILILIVILRLPNIIRSLKFILKNKILTIMENNVKNNVIPIKEWQNGCLSLRFLLLDFFFSGLCSGAILSSLSVSHGQTSPRESSCSFLSKLFMPPPYLQSSNINYIATLLIFSETLPTSSCLSLSEHVPLKGHLKSLNFLI